LTTNILFPIVSTVLILWFLVMGVFFGVGPVCGEMVKHRWATLVLDLIPHQS